MHCIGDAEAEIEAAEGRDERPARKLRVENENDDGWGRQDADHEPRLELAPARPRMLDDISHDGIV